MSKEEEALGADFCEHGIRSSSKAIGPNFSEMAKENNQLGEINLSCDVTDGNHHEQDPTRRKNIANKQDTVASPDCVIGNHDGCMSTIDVTDTDGDTTWTYG